ADLRPIVVLAQRINCDLCRDFAPLVATHAVGDGQEHPVALGQFPFRIGDEDAVLVFLPDGPGVGRSTDRHPHLIHVIAPLPSVPFYSPGTANIPRFWLRNRSTAERLWPRSPIRVRSCTCVTIALFRPCPGWRHEHMRLVPLLRLLPVLLVAGLLLACGGSDEEPTPTPSPQGLIDAAANRFNELDTAHYTLTIDGDVYLDAQGMLALRGAEGDLQRPDRATAKADIGFAGTTLSVNVVALGQE